MTLDAPEAHTTHELLELVAEVLGKIVLLDVLEVPGVILDAAVQEGPFDFGALYVPGKTGALQYLRGRGFPGELRGSVSQAFGTLDRLEDCRRSGKPLLLMNEDTQAGHSGGIEEALGAECALVIPLLNDPEDCPVLLLAAILHDVTGTGDGLCRSLQATYEFARSRKREMQRSLDVTRRWDRLIQAVDQALIFAGPTGFIVQSNAAASKLLGVSLSDLIGTKVNGLLPGFSYRSERWTGMALLAEGKTKVQVRTTLLPKDEQGRELYLHTVSLLETAPAPDSFAATAPLDSLNGLLDKQTFQADLGREMKLARKYHGWCSVLVVDLDGLSALRQVQGEAAIAVVREIGEALQERLRKSDRLGRLGGDGFGVLLSRGSREQALALGTSLLDLVKNRSTALGHPLTASIGISYFPDDADHAASLLETAFGAMMLAKRRGGDNALLWSSELMESRRNSSSSGNPRSTAKRFTDSQIPQEPRSLTPVPHRAPGALPDFERESRDFPPGNQEKDTDVLERSIDLNNLVIALPGDPSGEFD